MSPNSHRPSIDDTRRRLIAGSGAALTTALTAGCLSSLPPLGSGQRYGRITTPEAGDPSWYRKWLPAPENVDIADERYYFTALSGLSSRPTAPELYVARRAHQKAQLDYFGIGFENYDRLVDSRFGTAIEAEFDPQAVADSVTHSGYERSEPYRSFPVFERTDVPRRLAIGDQALIWTSAYQHRHPNVEAIIDTVVGNTPAYHNVDARFERLTDAAGANPYLGVNTATHDPTGRPAMLADAMRFDEDAAYQIVYYSYADGRTPTRDSLRESLEFYRFMDTAETYDVQVDGNLATIEARAPLRSNQNPKQRYALPQVTWGLSYDPTESTVTVRHEAGESVPASLLYHDLTLPDAPNRISKRPLFTDVETVSPGTTDTIDISDSEATGVSVVFSVGGTHFHTLQGREFSEASDE